jgi:hypothetical protein
MYVTVVKKILIPKKNIEGPNYIAFMTEVMGIHFIPKMCLYLHTLLMCVILVRKVL